jgi:flagellin-like protein
MKANQNFRRDDEAVSPVIGVILMVAITVVLAAVVFVMVNNLGDQAEPAPPMSFSRDVSNSEVMLVRGPTGLDWSHITVTGCTDWVQPASGLVSAGTKIGPCEAGDTVTIIHNASNTLLYQTTL